MFQIIRLNDNIQSAQTKNQKFCDVIIIILGVLPGCHIVISWFWMYLIFVNDTNSWFTFKLIVKVQACKVSLYLQPLAVMFISLCWKCLFQNLPSDLQLHLFETPPPPPHSSDITKGENANIRSRGDERFLEFKRSLKRLATKSLFHLQCWQLRHSAENNTIFHWHPAKRWFVVLNHD